MGWATHLGPQLLGTVKETTGTSVALGQVANTGVASAFQLATIPFGVMLTSPAAQNLFALPAGAKIIGIYVEVITAISGGSVSNVGMTLGLQGGTANFYVTTVNTGLTSVKLAQATVDAAMVVANTNNIGTADVMMTGTFTAATGNPTAGALVVVVEYMVRDYLGNMRPVSA